MCLGSYYASLTFVRFEVSISDFANQRLHMKLTIKQDDLTSPDVIDLLQDHLDGMFEITPPESVHALGLEELKAPSVTVWSAWDGEQLAGIGALKELDGTHAEIKSMRTASDYLRKGIGRSLLQFMIDEANRRGYKRLSLETGSQVEFQPARDLFHAVGFEICDPFADYILDPNSVFMTKQM